MFTSLFFLALIPIIPIGFKIIKKKELNLFDISVVFSALYFCAIPLNDFFFNHFRPQYIGRMNTAYAICIFIWLQYFVSLIYSKKGKSALIITQKLKQIQTITVKDTFQWFALVYIGYMFYKTTDYSSLSKYNLEGNINFFYGANTNIILKMVLVTFREFLPAIFLILWTNNPKRKFYRILRKINLALIIATILLGNKGFMIYNCVFLFLYLYSTQRDKITKKKITMYLSAVVILFSIIFPLSQSFRYYKQETVSGYGRHDFTTTAKGFVTEGIDDDLKDRVDAYQKGRSLNLYDAVDFGASVTSFKGNGLMTAMILKYIIPQRIDNDGNIMAELMLGGGDVGESILAWYVLDWGFLIGPFVAVIHMILIFLLYYYLGIYFNRWIKSSVYPLVIYTIILRTVIGVEHNPVTDIKMIYSTYYLIIIFVGVVLYTFTKKTKISKSTYKQ